MISSAIFVSFLIFGINFSLGRNEPIVKTLSGPIMGMIQTSRKGLEFYAFRGIRYAEPPVGDLRFKPPVPILSWDDILDATEDGPECLQPPRDEEIHNQSEDCLFLNVYTHRINENDNLRPVLVYIHGGAYVNYAGISTIHGPQYLMDHDIVLVTLNYRLNTLGFLSTGDSVAPGNYGMKDQVAALQWVQNNIKFFGGDPNKVTIAGESAGGTSVSLHLLSPMSKGLFHGAIAASGGAANIWSINRDPLESAKKVADVLDCPTDTSENLIDCLRQRPAEQVAHVYTEFAEWYGEPSVVMAPVVETDDTSERFLTKDPIQGLIDGESANVPLLIGTTKDEMAVKALPVLYDEQWITDLSTNWSTIAPIAFGYGGDESISLKLREFYLGSSDEPITSASFEGLGQLFADSDIIFGVVRSAKLIAEKNSAPVYLYQFNYQGENSSLFHPGTNEALVLHADDMNYIFYAEGGYPFIDTTSQDGYFVDKITTMWKNFVETGNPTPEPLEVLGNVIWTPLDIAEPSYLEINKNLTLVNGIYYEDRMALWENLFPLND